MNLEEVRKGLERIESQLALDETIRIIFAEGEPELYESFSNILQEFSEDIKFEIKRDPAGKIGVMASLGRDYFGDIIISNVGAQFFGLTLFEAIRNKKLMHDIPFIFWSGHNWEDVQSGVVAPFRALLSACRVSISSPIEKIRNETDRAFLKSFFSPQTVSQIPESLTNKFSTIPSVKVIGKNEYFVSKLDWLDLVKLVKILGQNILNIRKSNGYFGLINTEKGIQLVKLIVNENIYRPEKDFLEKDFLIVKSFELQSRDDHPKQILNKIEEFEYLINSDNIKENDIQIFFEKNPEFLLSLGNYEAAFSQIVLQNQDYNFIPDFLLKPLTSNYLDIVELKLPKEKVIVSKKNRARFSSAVYEGIAQLRTYRNFFRDSHNREVFFLRDINFIAMSLK